MTTNNEIKDCHIALATGNDAGGGAGLLDWRNTKTNYVAGELIPADQLLGWRNKPPIKLTQKQGSMTATRVSNRFSVSRQLGEWWSKHAFQTAQFCYWLAQKCTTVENTPASYNTHTIVINTVNTPVWHGIHFEREGIGSNELRYDLAGLCPQDLEINCGASRDSFNATQEITIPYAWLGTTASDIAAQTIRPAQTTGSLWKTWDHLIAGLGAGNIPTGLTYNSGSLEVNVINLKIKLHRDIFIGGIPDTSGYFQAGLMLGWDYSYVLDVVPVGDALYYLNDTAKEDYAGDLDYDFQFQADVTNDYIRFNNDKLYLVPFDEENDWNKYFEGYTITLEPYDTTSSLIITSVDNLDNNHFENP